MVNVEFDICSQDGTGSRIHVVDLMAYWTGYRLIGVVVLRHGLLDRTCEERPRASRIARHRRPQPLPSSAATCRHVRFSR